MNNGKKQSKTPTRNAPSEDREQQLLNRRNRRGNGEIAEWDAVDGGRLAKAVNAVARAGYALSLGYSRDGGAYSIYVVGFDGWATEYVRPSEDINLYLDGLAEDFAE